MNRVHRALCIPADTTSIPPNFVDGCTELRIIYYIKTEVVNGVLTTDNIRGLPPSCTNIGHHAFFNSGVITL